MQESTDAPIFELERVQYTVPAPLVSLAVSSDLLVMGMLPNEIVMIELTRADQIIRMTIPRNEFTLHKVFVDPSGRHIVVTSTQGENWYLFKGWKKPKLLKSFKMVIESMAWNKTALLSSGGSTSSREILIGARNGTIYEGLLDAEEDFFKSPDRHIQSVYSTQERQPITGIKFDIFPPQQGTKALVIATTPSRIYQFVGSPDRKSEEGGRVFGKLFAKYRDTAPSEQEPRLRSSLDVLTEVNSRDLRATWKPETFRTPFLHPKRGPGTVFTSKYGMVNRCAVPLLCSS